jgi:hypothetical protein
MTTDAPPGTEGAAQTVVIGVAGMAAGAAAFAYAVGLDADGLAWNLVVAVGAGFLFVGFFAANAGLQCLRARRAAVRTGPHDWACVVVIPPRFMTLRLFAVGDAGTHLFTLGGRHLTTWRWKDTTKAVGLPVEVGGRTQPGLTLEGTLGEGADWAVAMGFPGRYGFGPSPQNAEAALAAVRRRLPPVTPGGTPGPW